MELNANFSERVLVHSDEVEWLSSPMPGVERRMLDRIGDEVARATTIVRYAPGSQFSPHVHTGGEEFFVIDGVFQDEHGDFPAGCYVRNPPTSSHTPGSELGCTILVKLWQYDMSDRTMVMIDTNKMGSVPDANRSGISVMPLFQDDRETVQIEIWDPGAKIEVDAKEGAELFVLEGSLEESGDILRKHSWLRVPIGGHIGAAAGIDGAKVWMKTRHLRFINRPVSP